LGAAVLIAGSSQRPPMLLTLSAQSFGSMLSGAKPKIALVDLPKLAHDELGLNGLVIQTPLLTGWDIKKVEHFRDRADKANCPCLLLVEPEAQRIGASDPDAAAAAEDRMSRVLQAAHRLGCSGVAMRVHESLTSVAPEALSAAIKRVVQRAERLELNLLIGPNAGPTFTPERLTGVIRKVGGFRIGSFPDFEAASKTPLEPAKPGAAPGPPDAAAYLRALTPYASVVSASFGDFDASGKHKGYDFSACVDAVSSVGFDQTMSLEYRGSGPPQDAITRAKAAVEALVMEAPKDDDTEQPADDE